MLQHASLDNGQSRANVKSIPGASPTCPECECTGKKNECPVCPGAVGGYEENVGSYDLSIGDIRADDTTLPFGVAGEVSSSATTGTKSHVTFKIVLSIRNGAKIDEVIKLIEDFSGLYNTQMFNGTADVTISATDTALTISASFDVPTLDDAMSSFPVHEFLSRGPIKIKGHMGSAVDPNQLLDAPADTYDISADAKFAESLRVEYSDAFWEYLSKYMGSYEQQLVDSFASSSGSDDAAPAPAPVDDSPLEPIYKTASYKALASAYKAEIASAEKPNMVDIQREVQLEFAKLLFGAQYKVQFGSLTNLLRAAAGQRPRLLMLLEAASPRVASWVKSPMSLLTSWNLAKFKQLVWGPALEQGATDQILATPLPLVFQTLGGVLSLEATVVQPTWTGQVTLKLTGFDRVVEFLPDEWIR